VPARDITDLMEMLRSWSMSSIATARVSQHEHCLNHADPSDLYKTTIVDSSANKSVTVAYVSPYFCSHLILNRES